MADSHFFPTLAIGKIPEHKLVTIKNPSGKDIAVTPEGVAVPLIYDDEFEIKVNSSFKGLGDPKGNTLMTLLSGITDGVLPSGQYALQNIQIWESTAPLSLDFSVKVQMRDNGYNDVVYPIKQLMKLVLPKIKDSGLGRKLGALIPPGPSLMDMLTLSQTENAGVKDDLSTERSSPLVSVNLGRFTINNCVVQEVIPSFSNAVDSNGYPVSADVSIGVLTVMVATQNMIDSMIK